MKENELKEIGFLLEKDVCGFDIALKRYLVDDTLKVIAINDEGIVAYKESDNDPYDLSEGLYFGIEEIKDHVSSNDLEEMLKVYDMFKEETDI